MTTSITWVLVGIFGLSIAATFCGAFYIMTHPARCPETTQLIGSHRMLCDSRDTPTGSILECRPVDATACR